MPFYPLKRLAIHFENGAKKYGDRNWEKGQPLNEYLSSAARHLGMFTNGANDEDHLAAVIWNCMAHIETQRKIEEGILPQSLLDNAHPNIKGRIQMTLHNKIVASKLDEMGKEIKEKIDQSEKAMAKKMTETIEFPREATNEA